VGIGFAMIGRKIGQEIKKFVSLVFEARKDDNRNAMLFNSAGDDSVPLDDERLVLVKTDGTGKYVAVGVLAQSQGAKPGEKIFYGRNQDGGIVSKLSFLNDGTIKLEGEKDFIKKIKGESGMEIEKSLTVKVKGDITFEGTSDTTHKTSGKFTKKGATIEISGDTELILKSIGTAGWCPNGVPNCFITGAPHGGPAMGITGLKGG